jgi:hypothetical protein
MIDFNINSGAPYVVNDVESILQQIDILFDTTPKEILGAENYGTTYDKFLYDLKMNNDDIKRQVISDLSSLDLMDFDFDVEVHMLQGTEQDIALIEITLTRDEQSFNRIYKIS